MSGSLIIHILPQVFLISTTCDTIKSPLVLALLNKYDENPLSKYTHCSPGDDNISIEDTPWEK
ncbi:hypothetical protein KAI60_04380 [Candidatus Bathyarchaeota archaeon]|nr:hypothetical protein [Candidatus Bathyarchaeota archaeon]